MQRLFAGSGNPAVWYFLAYKTAKIAFVVFKANSALPSVLESTTLRYAASGAGFRGIAGGGGEDVVAKFGGLGKANGTV